MLWPGLARRFPVLEIRDFRLLLADRVLAPAAPPSRWSGWPSRSWT